MAETTYSKEFHDVKLERLSDSARAWYGVGGVVFIILAGIAFAIPVAATFAANIWLAALLAVAGVFETIGAFRRHDGWGAAGEALFGIVTFIAGVLAVVFPLAGIVAFTAVLIAFFLISGLVRLVQGVRRRPQRVWVLNVLSGAISVGLGLFLLFMLPAAALVTLGILLAVDFAFFGVALILTAIYGERPVTYPPPDSVTEAR